MSQSSKLYDSLTHQQRQFYKEKTFSGTQKIKVWINFLSKISILDKLTDGKIKILKTAMIVCFILAFASIFVAVGMEDVRVAVVTLVLIGAGVFIYQKRQKLKEQDVNNYLRQFFLPVLNVLKDKVKPDTKLSANLDFRNPRKAQKPVESKVGGRTQKLFSPTYIISRVALSDDSLLEFVVKDDIKDLNWTKRSASGKTKYKKKTKFVHQCMIKMTLSTREYTWNESIHPDIQIVEDNGNYLAKVKVKIKKLGDNVLHVKAFFEAIQSIYEQFQPLNPTTNATTSRDDSVEYQDDFLMVPYVWYGGYFDQYDYDSFDYSDTGEIMTEGDTANVFDS